CAERNAIAYAVSNHPSEHVIAIAVVAANEKGITAEPASPGVKCRLGKKIFMRLASSFSTRS
ncbi:MAG TPA: hypothetical protein VHO68_01140, partial [Bacteroidales bacterium]|nr:hypothetical protein [Bacteroidales bacterium]